MDRPERASTPRSRARKASSVNSMARAPVRRWWLLEALY
jgi:hypothetical protein